MTARLLALMLILGLVLAGCGGGEPVETPGDTEPTEALVEGDDDAPPGEPEPEPYIEEQAIEILGAMAKTLREATRFSVEAEGTVEAFLSTGHAIELESTVAATFHSPDGVLSERVADGHHRRLHYDGKQVTLVDVSQNLYASREMTGTLDDLVERLKARFGVVMPLADLIVKDADKALSEFADWGTYLGIHRVRGRPCHHMIFANDAIEWQIWVQAEGDPLPRKLVIIYRDEPGRPRFSAAITKWDLEAEFSDEIFAFTPGDGAVEIDIEEVPAPGEDADSTDDAPEEEGR